MLDEERLDFLKDYEKFGVKDTQWSARFTANARKRKAEETSAESGLLTRCPAAHNVKYFLGSGLGGAAGESMNPQGRGVRGEPLMGGPSQHGRALPQFSSSSGAESSRSTASLTSMRSQTARNRKYSKICWQNQNSFGAMLAKPFQTRTMPNYQGTTTKARSTSRSRMWLNPKNNWRCKPTSPTSN